MDREIKFRTWNGTDINYSPMFICSCSYDCCGLGININDEFEKSDLIFMQFTGRQDIRGIDIYEGDYLAKCSQSCMDFEIVEVYWDKLMASFYAKPITNNIFSRNPILGATLTSGMDKETKWEIVGNIYQNSKEEFLELYEKVVKRREEDCKNAKIIECNSIEELKEIIKKSCNQ